MAKKYRKFTLFEEYNNLKIIGFDEIGPYGGVKRCTCICKCGQLWTGNPMLVRAGNVKSCGKCGYKTRALNEANIKDVSGMRFGCLTAMKSTGQQSPNGYIWECRCDCGRVIRARLGWLTSFNTKSCGNCKMYKNGKRISVAQIKLQKIVSNSFNIYTILNYKSGSYTIDIACVIDGTKIAVEYDCWYFHSQNDDHDNHRMQDLIKRGWRVLRIRSRRLLPSHNRIKECIEKLLTCEEKFIIETMQDWGIGDTIRDRKKDASFIVKC